MQTQSLPKYARYNTRRSTTQVSRNHSKMYKTCRDKAVTWATVYTLVITVANAKVSSKRQVMFKMSQAKSLCKSLQIHDCSPTHRPQWTKTYSREHWNTKPRQHKLTRVFHYKPKSGQTSKTTCSQDKTIPVHRLQATQSEHLWPLWISQSKDSNMIQMDCEVKQVQTATSFHCTKKEFQEWLPQVTSKHMEVNLFTIPMHKEHCLQDYIWGIWHYRTIHTWGGGNFQ